MTDFSNRRLLGFSCATQFSSLVTLTIAMNYLGYEFCLEGRSCVITSVKLHLIILSLSIIAGWLFSGAFVVENENSSFRTNNNRRKVCSFMKAILITFLGSFFFHFITILYGAPFVQNMEETYLFSCSMAVMTLLHLMLVSNGRWWSIIQIVDIQLYKSGKIIDNVRLISFLAIIGALIGSAAIPLDWDRPWQVWPVPCCFGATVGYTSGLTIFTLLPLVEYFKFRHEQNKLKHY